MKTAPLSARLRWLIRRDWHVGLSFVLSAAVLALSVFQWWLA